jgi:hypothetical protein
MRFDGVLLVGYMPFQIRSVAYCDRYRLYAVPHSRIRFRYRLYALLISNF